jgi:hypothetical protein
MKSSRVLVVAALVCATAAPGQDAGVRATPVAVPTADELRRVLDYQEHGKDRGPVLLDLMPCLKVDTTKGSSTQYNCLEVVSGPIKKGTVVNAWTSWFCPKGGAYDDLAIQFVHEGVVRQTIDVKIEGLSRTRTYRSHTFSKAGKWQIKVLRADKELASATVIVEE